MIDWFNRRKLAELSNEGKNLSWAYSDLKGMVKKLATQSDFDKQKQATEGMVRDVAERVWAIAEFLGVRFDGVWEDDPNYPPPEPRIRRVIKAIRKENSK